MGPLVKSDLRREQEKAGVCWVDAGTEGFDA